MDEIGVVALEDAGHCAGPRPQGPPRQAGVGAGRDIGDADLLSDRELRVCDVPPGGAVAAAQVVDDLIVDRHGARLTGLRWGGRAEQGADLVLGDVALVDEELRDPPEPLLVVAKLEVVERVHPLGAGAQVRPCPLVPELRRHVGDRVLGGQRRTEMVAQTHHGDVDAEDPLLPLFDEHPLLEIQRLGG